MNEEMRKEFEEWYKLTLISESKASYKEREALFDYSFMVWQASREAMKPIKLPVSKEIYHMAQHGMTNMIDLEDTIAAIESAGYKVAP